MDRLHGILVFLRVVEHGSLSGAARALGVSTSAVSSTLSRLEKQLGGRLLIRTTRGLNTTPEGAEFYARCKQITTELAEAEVLVGRSARSVAGKIHVRLPQTLGRMWIIPALHAFIRKHPALAVEVVCMDFVPHTIEEGLDLSVQTGEMHDSSLAVRPLASARYAICGSPGYFAEHGEPQTLDDLAQHTCIGYRRPRNGRLRQWRVTQNGSAGQISVQSDLVFNNIELLREAALSGYGLIQLPECYLQPYLVSGELVETLKAHKAGGYRISAVYRQQQRMAPKLRVFMDFLSQLFEVPPWTGRQDAAAGTRKAASGGTASRQPSRRSA